MDLTEGLSHLLAKGIRDDNLVLNGVPHRFQGKKVQHSPDNIVSIDFPDDFALKIL